MISFNDLSDDEKAKVIWHHGEFVTTIYSDRIKFNLFSLSDFFVEVRFHRHTNEVMGISVLEERDLARYLGPVEISEALELIA